MKKINDSVKKKLGKDKLKVLLVGGGGREHAIAMALVRSKRLGELIVAPGNAGIAEIAKTAEVAADDLEAQVKLALEEAVDLVFVAPDNPLALGLTDRLWDLGIPAFGPSKRAARIEASKHFAKEIMARAEVPTAAYERFIDAKQAKNALKNRSYPLVIKADGLALGKGVFIVEDEIAAAKAIDDLLEEKIFGEAGAEILFEEFLTGKELTVLALTDGKSFKLLPSARDHKRIFADNKGPNTGGMGVISPVPEYNSELETKIIKEIIEPTLAELARSASTFKGVLYAGLILTEEGPKVIEFNARFGDPEAQAIIPQIESDFLDLIIAVIEERLEDFDLKLKKQAAATVVLASAGYPGAYEKGYPISGLDAVEEDALVFHAGTKKTGDQYLTNGGRVLAVTALADELELALEKCYRNVEKIKFEGVQYREDIGK